jgi:hypothetical protein
MSTEHKREQEERRQYLANEKLLREKAAEDRRASTYLAQALAASEDIGGRYKQVSPMTITGATPVPQMPQQPEGSPWSQQWPSGPDELGYSVEDIGEPSGSPAEVERAAEILREREVAAAALPSAADVDRVVEAPTAVRHHAGETSTRSTQYQSLAITGAAVVGEAGNSSAAKAVPRTFPRRL